MTSNCPGMELVSGFRLKVSSCRRRGGFGCEESNQVINVRCYSTWRQALQERLAIHLCAQSGIEHRQHSAISRASNQTTKSLLQTDNGLRNAVFIKTRAALIFDLSLARSHNWIAGNGERQLIDDHTRQLRATHVNAF